MLPYSHRCFGGAIRKLGGVLWLEAEPAAPVLAAHMHTATLGAPPARLAHAVTRHTAYG